MLKCTNVLRKVDDCHLVFFLLNLKAYLKYFKYLFKVTLNHCRRPNDTCNVDKFCNAN